MQMSDPIPLRLTEITRINTSKYDEDLHTPGKIK